MNKQEALKALQENKRFVSRERYKELVRFIKGADKGGWFSVLVTTGSCMGESCDIEIRINDSLPSFYH